MASTFDPALPTQRDWVRWYCGDVSSTPQWWLDDETIDALLASGLPVIEAAAECADNIGGQLSQLAQETQEGSLRIRYGERAQLFYERADRLRDKFLQGPDSPAQTGAQTADMQEPDISNYLVGLPPCDPMNPRRTPGAVP